MTLQIDIRAMRREANVGLDDAAEWMQVPRSTLAHVENGKVPSLGHALRIAAFMKMDVEQIWKLS